MLSLAEGAVELNSNKGWPAVRPSPSSVASISRLGFSGLPVSVGIIVAPAKERKGWANSVGEATGGMSKTFVPCRRCGSV